MSAVLTETRREKKAELVRGSKLWGHHALVYNLLFTHVPVRIPTNSLETKLNLGWSLHPQYSICSYLPRKSLTQQLLAEIIKKETNNPNLEIGVVFAQMSVSISLCDFVGQG